MIGLLLAPAAGTRASEPGTAPVAAPTPIEPRAEVIHDHAPRQEGVVAMSGTRHVEAALRADGRLRVHVSDLHRTALSVAGAHGDATPHGATTSYPFVVRGDALEAQLPPPAASPAEVRITVVLRDGERLLVDFTLPVAAR